MRCANCPLEAGEICLAEGGNAAYAWMCANATAGPSPMNAHIVAQCALVRDMRRQGPGLLKMAGNLATALVEHARSGLRHAPPEVQAGRLAICRRNDCGYYDGADGERCRHGGCGCFLTVKVAWADSSCPLEPPLWGPVSGVAP